MDEVSQQPCHVDVSDEMMWVDVEEVDPEIQKIRELRASYTKKGAPLDSGKPVTPKISESISKIFPWLHFFVVAVLAAIEMLASFFDTAKLAPDWTEALFKLLRLPENSPVGPVPQLNDFLVQDREAPFWLMKGIFVHYA